MPHDQGYSSPHLIPGINGSASMAAIKHADNDLARMLAALKEAWSGIDDGCDPGLGPRPVHDLQGDTGDELCRRAILKTCHRRCCHLASFAIDLAHVLRMNLFDPDATGDTKNIPVSTGSFPIRGNGLIGDEAAQPEVVVTANGGSDLIYLPSPEQLMAARIVQFLAAQDYVSGIFVDSRLGSIGGTLPLSAVALEGLHWRPRRRSW